MFTPNAIINYQLNVKMIYLMVDMYGFQKNPAFMKLVQSRSDAQDYDSELMNDYKRELVCKAMAAENIIKYSNERANRFTDIGFQECIEFLQKHAPEQLEAVLSQYDN